MFQPIAFAVEQHRASTAWLLMVTATVQSEDDLTNIFEHMIAHSWKKSRDDEHRESHTFNLFLEFTKRDMESYAGYGSRIWILMSGLPIPIPYPNTITTANSSRVIAERALLPIRHKYLPCTRSPAPLHTHVHRRACAKR